MHLNVITDYVRPIACELPYRTVTRWAIAIRAGLHRKSRLSIPQHQIDIVSGLLSIDRLWTVRELSVEIGLSHQTVQYKLKKWRILVRSVAVIHKQFTNGILWLPDI
ncbi:hypothetical protein AVEN_165380-1 [Araneus ventricosus]|uniref:Uncharacterized protein n=1 Tax=Araneus ventricosus TaxID=182803 RepID=A0A4Y2AVG5_ARAVE|nr:hypothetical protein AVEN_165380-1 [Araneus ventricosus]